MVYSRALQTSYSKLLQHRLALITESLCNTFDRPLYSDWKKHVPKVSNPFNDNWDIHIISSFSLISSLKTRQKWKLIICITAPFLTVLFQLSSLINVWIKFFWGRIELWILRLLTPWILAIDIEASTLAIGFPKVCIIRLPQCTNTVLNFALCIAPADKLVRLFVKTYQIVSLIGLYIA